MDSMMLSGLLAAISVTMILYLFLKGTVGQEALEQRKIQERFRGLLQFKRDSILRRESKRSLLSLNHLFAGSKTLAHIDGLLRFTTWNFSAINFLILIAVIGFVMFWVSNIFVPNFELSSLVMVISGAVPYLVLRINRTKYIQKFILNFPDALSMMKNSVKAGQGIQSSFKTVALESPFPVNQEFKKMMTEIELGAHLDEALSALYERIPVVDVRIFVLGLTIQMEMGGNISDLFDNIGQTIRDRITLKREMDASTAQAKISAIVLICLPFIIFVAMNVINPGYLSPLFKEELGHKILWAAGMLLTAGSLLVLKIVQGPKMV